MTPHDYALAAASAVATCIVVWAFLWVGLSGDLILQEIFR